MLASISLFLNRLDLNQLDNECGRRIFYLYKERERIHRNLLICDYYRFRLHEGGLQPSIRTEEMFEDWLRVTPLLPIVIPIVGCV